MAFSAGARAAKAKRDRRVEDEVERDVEEGAAFGRRGKAGKRPVHPVERPVGEKRQDGGGGEAAGDHDRRDHAEAEARECRLVGGQPVARKPDGGGIGQWLHDLQGETVKHGSPRRS
jgi:hypothetical protein